VAAALLVSAVFVPRLLFPVNGSGGSTGIASTATLAFREPADGATLAGDDATIVLDLEGGTVVDRLSQVTPDTGHLHVSVDGKLVSMTYGEEQVIDLRPYGAGTHTMVAEFVAADHRSFAPPVTASITFERPPA
jgi:hypothetical protein